MEGKRSYHFSCGNSTHGPIGFCASIWASSEQEALEALRAHLPEEISVQNFVAAEDGAATSAVEYIRVYLNPEAVTLDHIDDD